MTAIPDIVFPSYDDFRKWERAADSIMVLAEMLVENKNNVALCEEILATLVMTAEDCKDSMFDIIDLYTGKDQALCDSVLLYQTTAGDMVETALRMSDQIKQADRRNKQKD